MVTQLNKAMKSLTDQITELEGEQATKKANFKKARDEAAAELHDNAEMGKEERAEAEADLERLEERQKQQLEKLKEEIELLRVDVLEKAEELDGLGNPTEALEA